MYSIEFEHQKRNYLLLFELLDSLRYVCCSDQNGIPETVQSDNGSQPSSQEFAWFANSYEFKHVTSGPMFPQSNGQVEWTIQTVKRLLKRSNDPCLALLSYHATPLPWCDISPAQPSIGRRIQTPIPQTNKLLVPNWAYLKTFCEKNKQS